MIYQARGTVVEVGKTQQFASGFTKRSIIVDLKADGEKYPNVTKFDAIKDSCSTLDGINVGDVVDIKFAVNGRQWDGPKGRQYFVDLRLIKIEAIGGSKLAAPSSPNPPASLNEPDDTEMPF